MNILELAKSLKVDKKTQFVAPSFWGSDVALLVNGLKASYKVAKEFHGFGVFETSNKKAKLVREAEIAEILQYKELLKRTYFILISRFKDNSWIAYPAYSQPFSVTFWQPKPTLIHFVEEGQCFDTVKVSFNGQFLYDGHAFNSTTMEVKEHLISNLEKLVEPQVLSVKNLSPEMKVAYSVILNSIERENPAKILEKKIKDIVMRNDGKVHGLVEKKKSIVIRWTSAAGNVYNTEINTDSMFITSAGLCLDGDDRKFDFQALMGIVNQKERFGQYQ